jgi:hypothetical protein
MLEEIEVDWKIDNKSLVVVLTTEDGSQFLNAPGASGLLGKDRQYLNSKVGYITKDEELIQILQTTRVPKKGGIKFCTNFISQAEFLRFIVDYQFLNQEKAKEFVGIIFAQYAKRSNSRIVLSDSSSDSSSNEPVAVVQVPPVSTDIMKLAREAYLASSKWKKAKEEIDAKVNAKLQQEEQEIYLKDLIQKCIMSEEFAVLVNSEKTQYEKAQYEAKTLDRKRPRE